MKPKVAIQGTTASFHDIAAGQFFDDGFAAVDCDTFADTFAAVDSKRAEYAVCAIENSLFGSINEVYDLLVKHHFEIIGEVYLRIEQCLIGLPDAQLADIQEVHSHPVALAQCEVYLDENLPNAQRHESHDTAASVAMLKEQGQKSIAAIGSRQAAKLYGLKILAAEIETNQQNYTRFIILAPAPQKVADSNKTSLIIKTSHQPGALYRALGAFAERAINLSKLQSRPIIGKAWHYSFYVDAEAGLDNPALKEALDDLKSQDCQVTVLGSYLAGHHS